MKLSSPIYLLFLGMLLACPGIFLSCNAFNEELPECRLFVRFKYDYNVKSVCAFHEEVDIVELYVFDKEGKFLFKQAEEGEKLSTGQYLMEVEVPFGEYRFMAWAGARDSYEICGFTPGVTTLREMELKLKRAASCVVDHSLEPLWYGEIIDVTFTGKTNQVETINLIKDTNQVTFIFQSTSQWGWGIDLDEYDYEIIDANGYLAYDNSLNEDEPISYQPYEGEQLSPEAIRVELNTMRIMDERDLRFVVTDKQSGKKVLNINLAQYLSQTRTTDQRHWSIQEYFDRRDKWHIVFYLADSWTSIQLHINDWTWYIQDEEIE